MSNKVRGKIDFDVDDETYSLHFTANGMCELEDAAECSAMAFIMRLEKTAEDGLSFGDARLLFWAGLQEHHPDLSVRDAGALMTKVGGMVAAMDLAGRAVAAMLPTPKKEGGPTNGKKKKGAS